MTEVRPPQEATRETPAPPETDVVGAAASGVLWLTAQKWIIRLTGFVTIAFLTRLLVPEDFGTVAAAGTLLPFFYLFADLGFSAYIVQADRADDRMLSTAVWFSCLAGIILCGGLWIFAPFMGGVFKAPGVVDVLRALSMWVVITSAGAVPLAILRRRMQFRVIALQATVAAFGAQVAAIVLALRGAGVWALVAQVLVSALLTTAMSWVTVRWRPRFQFDYRELASMTRFGGFVVAVEVVALGRAWGEAAVTAAVLGTAALGLMTVAQRLVQMVQDLSGSAIVPVTNVAFAAVRSDSERLRAAYLRSLRMVILALSLPLTVVAVAAPVLVPLMFGPGWTGSIGVTQILALAGTLTTAAWLDHGLFYGLGRPGTWLWYAVVTDAVTLATTMALASHGLTAIALGFLVVAIVATVGRTAMVRAVMCVGWRSLAGPYCAVVLVVMLSGTAGWLTLRWITGSMWLTLMTTAAVVTAAHLVVSSLVARETLTDFVGVVRRAIRSLRSRQAIAR
ncbi:lipopolysaccharide biosynthesis protein [Calidifontibacter indicus]|uniref:O-antigen/teichoic acid export membrane protein n=1 Tax=Calidifontibacter indicus TaxID=419650 RepID=A0A3D9UUK7_9MICO|nr:lipopolysaccharide biosynthesis protein [Calidifontibacter indicus]REF31640.1 O-antigen/teichoic acid export membrane protein [Calidifontibacter indicus]